MDIVNNRHPLIRHLGLEDYEPVWRRMQAFTRERDEATADEIWLVEHPPVFTQGQAGKAEHILAPGDIPVIQVDRGGQVTYHGPGQMVMYPLIDLNRLGIGVRQFVTRLEQCIIDFSATFGIQAERLPNAPGVYVEGRKLASLGLRVKRGRSFHGVAFNINMDLEPFSRINPCGFANLQVTQLVDLVDPQQQATIGQQGLDAVRQPFLDVVLNEFGFQQSPIQEAS